MVHIDTINIDSLIKAYTKFEQFRKQLETEQEQAGAIQAFNSPRETFREAAIEGLIADPEIWFDFIKARNLTVYAYDEENVQSVLLVFDNFAKELQAFLHSIGALRGALP
ncbi:MAG TPA: nucleotidyltransferase substrate binding protein [Candidatus Babeliales bacterium]|jgi:hypothetical protein|nr:nucleotidyltransferase substrate binding protein [Candidatus Babeliales bacterium]